MQKHMLKRGVVLIAVVIAAWVGIWVPQALPAPAPKAPVAVTGQTTIYALGDDGDIQAGVPFPTPRFTDDGNGTVRDNLTGLIWLRNADCFGAVTWTQALTDANTLHTGTCDLTDGSVAGAWRLPNVKELQSLIDFGFRDPALSNAAGTAQWTQGDAFVNVQSERYWSSTTLAVFTGNAWLVDLVEGTSAAETKDTLLISHVWPVRERK